MNFAHRTIRPERAVASGIAVCVTYVGRMRLIALAAITALAALPAACGGDTSKITQPEAQPAFGADTPEHAVESFIAAAGHPGDSYKNLVEACRQLAPSVRPAVRFNASVSPTENDCAAGLSLLLFYTGEASEDSPPSGFTGKVTGSAVAGARAIVTAQMTYVGAASPGSRPARILVVNEQGSWWVATPTSLNIRATVKQPTDEDLAEQYDRLADAAKVASQQAQAGHDAETELTSYVDECARDGASSAQDASGDVKVADGMMPAKQQLPGHDLVGLVHSSDAEHACFELRFAGDAPDNGSVELAVRPSGGRVVVNWEHGRVVGQRGDDDSPQPVSVLAARDGSTMTFRLDNSSLGITGGRYRWAAEVFVNADSTGRASDTDVDSVPDDLTVMGDDDHYIPHAG